MPAPNPSRKSVVKPTHGPRPKTKPPSSVDDQLKRLFKTLVAQIDGGHHTNAIKTCDKILKLSPGDADALQTKLFLLLTTDQAGAALTLIESLQGENGDNSRYNLERAYALYCSHKRDDARETLAKGTGDVDARGAQHLEAQLSYRDGAYQQALDVYNELLDSAPTAEEQSDIMTNIEAVEAHLTFINTTFLQTIHSLPASIQHGLEDAPPPLAAPVHSIVPAVAAANPPAPPKAKKVRLPKGVVPGVTPPPDPERWLKKSERTSFAQRRRKGGGGATQGSAADVPVVAESKASGAAKNKGKKRK
ncbi:unnamed protein product [Mycena citricolor]|uniref:Signal recognition particle subunit SRP72 n=1 Tax=Mycena citricolor TaxID=2018698 RepID=A0AAD2HKH6_9AGAR|nr:unnamed protein product [Mycena citricolor]